MVIYVILLCFGLISNYALADWESDHSEQLRQTQERVKQRILNDIDYVKARVQDQSDIDRLNQIASEVENDSYPSLLRNFRAILPLNSYHTEIYSIYSKELNARGYNGLQVWKSHRFEPFDLFTEPKSAPVSQLDIKMMRNERHSTAISVTNASETAKPVMITVSGVPQGAELRIKQTVFVDTKRGYANPSALLDAKNINGNKWLLTVPSGLTSQVWFTIDSKDMSAGNYNIPIRISSGTYTKDVSLSLTTVPLRFPDRPRYNLMMYDYAVSKGRAVTSQNQQAAINDLKEHLVSMFQLSKNDIIPMNRSDFDSQGNLIHNPSTTAFKNALKLLPADVKYYNFFLNLKRVDGNYQFAGFPVGSQAGKNALKNWLNYLRQTCEELRRTCSGTCEYYAACYRCVYAHFSTKALEMKV